jgi:hypothetical protein
MCQCAPEIRTPFCGKPGCQWPEAEVGAKEKTAPPTREELIRALSDIYHFRSDKYFDAARKILCRCG